MPRRPRRRARAIATPRAASRGFTIIELLVAMMMLSIGLLGLAGTSTIMLRQITGGAQQSVAASLAQSRLERMRAVQCTRITVGTATTRGITEVWTKRDTTRAVIVTDTVKYTVRGVQRKHAYRSMIPCPQNP